MKCIVAAVVVVVLGCATSAGAQVRPVPPRAPAPSERIFISVNGAFQMGGEDFGETVTITRNAESGNFSTAYTVDAGPAFDVSGTYAITRQFGVGAGITRFSKSTPTTLDASVPHPFFFNQNRAVSGEIPGLTRKEFAFHIQARGILKSTRQIEAMVFGGPSFFSVEQGIVTDFTITEAYPFDTATFGSGTLTTVSESKMGFNFGGDVGYYFTDQIGVGGSAQWAGTTIDVPSSSGDGTTFELKVGGFQFGGGLRLRF